MSGPESRRPRLPFAPAHHCVSCGAPITPHQAVGEGGVCHRLECRAARTRRQMAESRRLQEVRLDRARAWLAASGVDPRGVRWSVVPANRGEPVPLSGERREAFLRHLHRIVGEAVETPSDGPSSGGTASPPEMEDPPAAGEDEGRFPPPRGDEARALGAACATCRGWCCRQGGTHAFLEAGRIRRLLGERPDLDPSGVVELYAGYLGETHLRGGCVFQGETGCRLPREIRGDTCNAYHCPDLVQLRREWRRSGGGGVRHLVAVNAGQEEAVASGTTIRDPGEP